MRTCAVYELLRVTCNALLCMETNGRKISILIQLNTNITADGLCSALFKMENAQTDVYHDFKIKLYKL